MITPRIYKIIHLGLESVPLTSLIIARRVQNSRNLYMWEWQCRTACFTCRSICVVPWGSGWQRSSLPCLVVRGHWMGRPYGWGRKNRGPGSRQVWHDKDPSLLKDLNLQPITSNAWCRCPLALTKYNQPKSDSDYRICTVDDNVEAHRADTQHLNTV